MGNLIGNRSGAGFAEEKLRYVHYRDTTAGDHEQCVQCNPNNHSFCTNYIRTTKYTLVTFLPVNLFEQFMKKANFYFLIIAILSTTSFSPKTPLVSIVPLVFVLAVTAVKEALEDYRRYLSDVEMNNTKVKAWKEGHWEDITWANVQVGDLLCIHDGHAFPADLLLLQSSARQGICNIETSNLDGETNLKIKQAVPETYEIPHRDHKDYPNKVKFVLESAAPNEKMDKGSWKGNLLGLNGKSSKIPLGMTQLLLRGCTLRNTKWIIALVAFTGLDTKLLMQSKAKKFKRSNVDVTVDRALYILFGFQAFLCSAGAIAYSIWLRLYANDHWYLPFARYSPVDFNEEAGTAVFSYLVLLDLLIPISLYVSMELVKFAQAWFINQDIDMYYADNDIPARARTSNLNEELGQLSYIFSDKTGTLTRNMMEFLRASIASVMYGPGEQDRANDHPNRLPPQEGIPAFNASFRFDDHRLVNNLINHHETAPEIDMFLTSLAVCHTVIPEYPDCDESHVHALSGCGAAVRYQAASPDELALVLAATESQYYFHHREPVKLVMRGVEINAMRLMVNILGKQWSFDILEILEFTSARKRMSVLYLDPRDKKIKVVCKGADNVIRERCNKKSLQKHWKTTEKHLQAMAAEGLRTLVVASRVIPNEEFDEWWAGHEKARASMANRDLEIASSAERLEKEFNLLGATAIEDRLQDGVPEAIAKLAQAGIKIWVLTGDKVETAINIGRSCNLLTPQMRNNNLLVVDIDESLEDTVAKRQTLEALEHCHRYLEKKSDDEKEHIGIVMSGKALGYVFPIRKLDANKREIIPPPHVLEEEDKLQRQFLGICGSCKAVVCCRMSPKQKSQVVMLVRRYCNDITLAIGDGANDVAMIEAAHVGIGIEGLEGKQAVMAADYAIGQFRFLLNLVLTHGAWSYRRISLLILYCFYKNATVSLSMMWFAIYSGFSAQIFFDPVSGSLYNMIFTAFPVLSAAIFNRDVSKENTLKYPELYKSGPKNEHFNLPLLCNRLFQAIIHSLVLFFFTIYTFQFPTKMDGTDNDIWVQGTAFYTCMIVLANLKISLLTTTWVSWTYLFVIGSVAAWFLWGLVYTSSVLFTTDLYWVFYRLLGMGNFWFIIVLAPVTCCIPDLMWAFLKRTYFFTRTDIVQEREKGYLFGPDLKEVGTALAPPETKLDLENPNRVSMLRWQNMTAQAKTAIEQKFLTEADVDKAMSSEEADRTWKQLAARVKNDHLGYVPFIEDDTGDAFVMGQKEFLRRYLAVSPEAAAAITPRRQMSPKAAMSPKSASRK